MPAFNNILETVGSTPLVRLSRIGAKVASPIYVKVEAMNPGGSVKDRIGPAMIEAAEQSGLLKPGGVIVEATAGNTGVGLAMAAAVKGYRLIVVVPDDVSCEKIGLLRAYGAEVVVTAANVPADSPESYNAVADRIARDMSGSFRPDQFNNPNNPQTHYRTTGREIWADSSGGVEVFVAGMGTGGSISGVGRFLKEQNPSITIIGAEPVESKYSDSAAVYSKVEGIGEDFSPSHLSQQFVDYRISVSDKESFNMVRRLAREEGILAGGSSGTALAAALKYACSLAQPRTMVVLLPDTGRNYLSKIFCDDWMKENGFWEEPGTSSPAPAMVHPISNQ